MNRIKHKNRIWAKLSLKLIRAAALSNSIGLLYAFKIGTINGLIVNLPVYCIRTNNGTVMKGISVRFCAILINDEINNTNNSERSQNTFSF